MGREHTARRLPAAERRVRLDRDLILDAAEAVVSTEGVGALTMRRIGAALGADPTAVYRHFRSKHELLVQLADRLFGIGPELDLGVGWQEALRIQMRYGLKRYRVHPDLAILLARQPDDTPSLQRIAERCLLLLAQAGLDPADAARMFHQIENHVVGAGLFYALIEHDADPRASGAADMRRAYALLPADEYPHAVAAAPHLFGDLDEVFELGSELLIDAIERLAQRRRAQATTPDDEDEKTP